MFEFRLQHGCGSYPAYPTSTLFLLSSAIYIVQRLQDQVLTLQVSNPFGLSATSRSRQPSLRPSSIAHLFQTSTIVLSNTMELRSGHRLIWLFSGSSENSGPVIISATKYGIAVDRQGFV